MKEERIINIINHYFSKLENISVVQNDADTKHFQIYPSEDLWFDIVDWTSPEIAYNNMTYYEYDDLVEEEFEEAGYSRYEPFIWQTEIFFGDNVIIMDYFHYQYMIRDIEDESFFLDFLAEINTGLIKNIDTNNGKYISIFRKRNTYNPYLWVNKYGVKGLH